MGIGLAFRKIGLVQVVGPDRVECRDVARHARHEGRQERGQCQPEQPRRAVPLDQRQNHAIVIIFRDGVLHARTNIGVAEIRRGLDDRIYFARHHLETRRLGDLLHSGFACDTGGRNVLDRCNDIDVSGFSNDFGWQTVVVFA